MKKIVAALAIVAVFVGVATSWVADKSVAYDLGTDPKGASKEERVGETMEQVAYDPGPGPHVYSTTEIN